MHQRKYFTLNFFINEIFSVEKFPNYSICVLHCIKLNKLIRNIYKPGAANVMP